MCDVVDFLVFVATWRIRDGLREERQELPTQLVGAYTDVEAVTHCETTIWLADGLLDLSTVLSKKGRVRKTTREHKIAVLCVINKDRQFSWTKAALAGIKLRESKKTPSKVCWSTWDWDAWSGYMSSSASMGCSLRETTTTRHRRQYVGASAG